MRLPQSIHQSLLVHTVHFLTTGIAIALLGMVPVSARAATAQLACTPTSLRFGTIVVGQTQTMLVTLTNKESTSVTISGVGASDSEFTPAPLTLPLVLAAGQSVDLSVSFTPTATGWMGGTINVSSNATNATLAVAVAGTGVNSVAVTASPSTVSFGQVAVGTSATLPVVITNDRSWNVTVSALHTKTSEFSISEVSLPLTLDAGQSLTLNVTFAPKSAAEVGDSLFVSGPMLAIPLTGTGTITGQLIIAPAPLSFGDVAVGTTQTEPITMSATGASVTVSSASGSSSQFVLGGASFPLTIPAGQSVGLNVAFTPQSSGTISGALSFASNASNSQAVESLTGIGTLTQYSVNLSWSASTSAVAGYNVYRSTSASGAYSKINPTLDANTAYTDSTVASGQTYYYAATSVTSAGDESGLSTPPVQAIVP
ncbi:MAG: choice-of-anchor D domain-containing protein [Candidatus Sulfotelmatobacter sp.]